MSSLYNRLRGKKTTPATATAVPAPQPAVLQSSSQQPKVSKDIFDTNANKALDAICKTPNIKSDLLDFTYNLKDDDRGQLINVLNSGNNKSEYDKIKANIRSEIERSNAVEEEALPSALSPSMPRPEEDHGRGIGASSSPSPPPTRPPPPSRQLSEEDLGGGEEVRLPEAPSSSIQDNAEDNAAATIQKRVRGNISRKGQRSVGGRRRTKKSKYYNKRKRTKGRRVKRRRSNKRRN
jgi:hypothetical protein